MSKTMIMLLNERVGEVKEVILGKSQIKDLEYEIKYSYAKQDYENLSEYRGIKITKSEDDYKWEEIRK